MRKLRKVFTLAATLLVIVVAVQHFGVQAEAYVQKLGTITTDTSLYESASSSSSVVMALEEGQSVTVNNEVTGTDGAIWYQLWVNGTDTGYVPSSVVTVTETSTEAEVLTTTTTTTVTTGTVTAGSSINVRSTASTSSTAVTQLANGDTFTVVSEETGDDGYVWYQAQFEQNGSTVTGYVRSDLVSVTTEEVEVETETATEEAETAVTTEAETEDTTSTEDPYRLVSQTNAEGEEIWYLVEAGSSSGYAIDDLLEAATSPASSSGGGGSRIVTVVLIILLIIAVAGLAFVFLRWRDAESTAEELREQNRRRRTTAGPAAAQGARAQTAQKPKQPAGAAAAGAAQNRPRTAAGQPAATAQTKTQQSVQARTQQSVQTRPQPTTQTRPQQTVRPAGSSTQQPASSTGRTVTPTVTPRAQQGDDQDADMKIRTSSAPKSRSERDQYEKISLDDLELDDFPDTDDIVSTTRKELNRKQDEPAAKPKTRKSRNFLDDDDDEDLEFDFLKLDDDE